MEKQTFPLFFIKMNDETYWYDLTGEGRVQDFEKIHINGEINASFDTFIKENEWYFPPDCNYKPEIHPILYDNYFHDPLKDKILLNPNKKRWQTEETKKDNLLRATQPEEGLRAL